MSAKRRHKAGKQTRESPLRLLQLRRGGCLSTANCATRRPTPGWTLHAADPFLDWRPSRALQRRSSMRCLSRHCPTPATHFSVFQGRHIDTYEALLFTASTISGCHPPPQQVCEGCRESIAPPVHQYSSPPRLPHNGTDIEGAWLPPLTPSERTAHTHNFFSNTRAPRRRCDSFNPLTFSRNGARTRDNQPCLAGDRGP